MSGFHDENEMWADGVPKDAEEAVADLAEDDLDELDGPPVEFRRGRRSRFPFAMTPQWVLLMTELSHPAFRLYCLMLAHVSSERDDQLVWPHQKTLAKLMGYSRKASVPPLVKLLVKLELVEVEEQRYGHNNSRRRNVYTVHEEPPAHWKGWASLKEFYAAEKAERKAARAAEQKAAAKARTPRGSAGQGQDAPAPAPSPEHGKSGEAAPAGRGHGEPGGSAAPVGAKPPPKKKAPAKKAGKAGVRMTREQAAAVATVVAAWPAELAALLPKYRPDVIRDAVLEAMSFGRSAEQLVERVQRRWSLHGYADALLPGGKGIGSPVGVAVGLVRPSTDCPDPMCEDGTTSDTGAPCRVCGERKTDRKADRGPGRVPEQREDRAPALDRWTCENPACRAPGKGTPPGDGLCLACRQELKESAARLAADCAAAEADRARAEALSWELTLEDAYGEQDRREAAAAKLREQRAAAALRRREEAERDRLLREQVLRDHPELASFAQNT
ncbi:helix-turn-helix domain-containing protein [Streptomyces sp. NPDC050392]|uniref:helix-turn-helix domain-containing protein n=1 Tax=Streptomyces sp. NPDC050392 TaxID=3155782 RepID=UPI0034360907